MNRYWNIDFVEGVQLYPIKSMNQLECLFIGLLKYDLFVSVDLYDKYYKAILQKTSMGEEDFFIQFDE